MSRGEADEALRLLDEAMALLELVEKSVGELAEAASSGERVSPGSVYSTYTSLVRLRDKLAELRGVLYSLASRGCGAGDPA
ncbi:hypothetical protein CF15_06650 [Pyrodictium occultum]|uniref:Uncharacterized protein n=1 Tax=Pyrodictium occultum TaxID=2309 RepID=A0A0V8RWQ2_PYROC|nr:hypothetical protein [Pyrodictium occultum]KSW12402.1 hypothetical protein CF15_06650 [Pyrodictium occultum]